MTASPTANPVILAAEDDDTILGLIVYRLENSGYRVITATDGEEALRLALAHLPALAVLDVMMPKLDGYEVTRSLRDHADTRDMPIIMLTARVQESDVERGYEAGADDYLEKPFSPQELRSRVQTLLSRPRAAHLGT
jgi:DNA-binding response OmpR family regulator